jgi:NitT/TauT family transport system substrate-binding protein
MPRTAPRPRTPARRARRSLILAAALACMAVTAAAQGQAQGTPTAPLQKFSFTTNWFAQAEHGGFYQALASGGYRAAGLDVSIRMGGPQVNAIQLMAAGRTDCVMGFDVQTMKVHEQGVRAVTVAAVFQKDAAVLIAHPGVVERLEDLKGRTILISSASHTSFWPWLRARYGLSDAQTRPYNFQIQPFLADRNIVQQGYFSSEPYAIEKEAGFKPRVFLLADHGWPPYATTIVCMEKTVRERPQAVAAFVRASMEGWRAYLRGDTAAADALIKRDNPAMTDDLLANGLKLMRETAIVTGGDAQRLGIGVVTDERMRRTFDMLVEMKLIDPKKVDLRRTYTTQFVRDLRVLP